MPELDLPSTPDAVATACDWVERHAVGLGWLPGDVTRVVLSVGEGVSNALEHGPSAVHVSLEAARDHLSVHISDGGRGPDAALLEAATLPDDLLATGGRGLFIMVDLADHVELGPGGGVLLTFQSRS